MVLSLHLQATSRAALLKLVTCSAYAEAANVEKIVTQLLRGGLSTSQIGIITPYEGQRTHVLALLGKGGPLGAAAYIGIEVCPRPVMIQLGGHHSCCHTSLAQL